MFKIHKLILIVLVVLMCFSNLGSATVGPTDSEETSNTKNVLYINSYHEGYKWSDDIYHAVEAVFDSSNYNVSIDVFYLDAQRVLLQDEEEENEYLIGIVDMISIKSNILSYDLIMTSDDAALELICNYCEEFDEDIPVLFAGVNNTDFLEENSKRAKGGIIEYIDVVETLSAIESIHPEIEKVYFVNDHTPTGESIEKGLSEHFDSYKSLEFEKLEGKNMEDLLLKASKLEENSIILFGIYFYDQEGNYFDYSKGIELLSENASVPIYGLWEFTLGNGIVGGKLLSGIDQGEKVAQMAINYFDNGIDSLEIVGIDQNQFKFDYEELVRHDISIDALPENSDIVNYNTVEDKTILILHSYDSEFQWTNSIHKGIGDALSTYDGEIEIFTEYMDLKRVSVPLHEYYIRKNFQKIYDNQEFDLILTSDDAAFEFAKEHLQEGDNPLPIIFCGVNYLTEELTLNHENYTGIKEAYDIKGTIDSIVAMQPKVEDIYVINDQSVTGLANNKNVETIEKEYSQLEFNYINVLSMSELQKEVALLPETTAILLMTFNKDRSNNTFSYKKSIDMIYEYASVPMYGVWDFYLGNGIVGGYLTNGYAQGNEAGKMAVQTLMGEDVSDIPIVDFSPNTFMFDMNQLEIHGIGINNLPDNALIINKDETFKDIYKQDPRLFNMLFGFFVFGSIIIMILIHYLRKSLRLHNQVLELAENDMMTGTLNRSTGIKRLQEMVLSKGMLGKKIDIYFIDLNELKLVNDLHGHKEGDHFILTVVEAIKKLIQKDEIFCRMGGDEFMVVRKHVDSQPPFILANKIKELLASKTEADEKPYLYSVSIGDYQVENNGNIDVSEIIEAADKKMYADKAAYHNRNI